MPICMEAYAHISRKKPSPEKFAICRLRCFRGKNSIYTLRLPLLLLLHTFSFNKLTLQGIKNELSNSGSSSTVEDSVIMGKSKMGWNANPFSKSQKIVQCNSFTLHRLFFNAAHQKFQYFTTKITVDKHRGRQRIFFI